MPLLYLAFMLMASNSVIVPPQPSYFTEGPPVPIVTTTPTDTETPTPTETATETPTVERPACPCDRDGDHVVSIAEIISGVNASLGGCPR